MVGASLRLAGRCDLWGAQGKDSACGIFIMNFFILLLKMFRLTWSQEWLSHIFADSKLQLAGGIPLACLFPVYDHRLIIPLHSCRE